MKTFDDQGRLIREEGDESVIQYKYNARGRLIEVDRGTAGKQIVAGEDEVVWPTRLPGLPR